jgi:hypothetical protein
MMLLRIVSTGVYQVKVHQPEVISDNQKMDNCLIWVEIEVYNPNK